MNLNSSAALESVSPYTPQTRTLGEKFINTQIMSFLLANKRVFQIGGDESARSMACCENHAHILQIIPSFGKGDDGAEHCSKETLFQG